MAAALEIWGEGRLPARVTLDGERVAIGRAPSNEIALDADAKVSRLHAVVERYQSGWCVRDLGSVNGTFLNGERLLGEQLLRAGDEIRVGGTRLLFKAPDSMEIGGTLRIEDEPPEVTRRERDVLVALCGPLSDSQAFAQPASTAEIARKLVVTEAAVKAHLANLYDKFEIREKGLGRRARLANEAIARGAVNRAELQAPDTDGTRSG